MNEQRYRQAEQRLFEESGIAPTEEWVALSRVGTRARVLTVGEGRPVLFLHGGPAAAAIWAPLVAHVQGVRCVLLDRPGTGLSEPTARVPDPATLPTYVSDLTADVLDALGIERAAVVGSSFGGYSALRSAIAYPTRVERIALLGCPAFVPGWTPPAFFKLLRTPVLRRVVVGAPPTRASARMSLRQMGHGRALVRRRISDAFIDWTRAWQRDTTTMRSDAAMINRCGTWRRGFDPSLDLTPGDLANVTMPVHIVGGADDPVGGKAVVTRLAELLPRATVEVYDGAGHLPWLDEPARAGAAIAAWSTLVG